MIRTIMVGLVLAVLALSLALPAAAADPRFGFWVAPGFRIDTAEDFQNFLRDVHKADIAARAKYPKAFPPEGVSANDQGTALLALRQSLNDLSEEKWQNRVNNYGYCLLLWKYRCALAYDRSEESLRTAIDDYRKDWASHARILLEDQSLPPPLVMAIADLVRETKPFEEERLARLNTPVSSPPVVTSSDSPPLVSPEPAATPPTVTHVHQTTSVTNVTVSPPAPPPSSDQPTSDQAVGPADTSAQATAKTVATSAGETSGGAWTGSKGSDDVDAGKAKEPELVLLPAPPGLTATVDGTSVTLAWQSVGGAKEYSVYRSEKIVDAEGVETQGSTQKMDTTDHAFYQDTHVEVGVTYQYWVAAVDKEYVDGEKSALVSALITPPPSRLPAFGQFTPWFFGWVALVAFIRVGLYFRRIATTPPGTFAPGHFVYKSFLRRCFEWLTFLDYWPHQDDQQSP